MLTTRKRNKTTDNELNADKNNEDDLNEENFEPIENQMNETMKEKNTTNRLILAEKSIIKDVEDF